MSTPSAFYKVKLASGRILGPLDLERVRLLILKGRITGVESAREYPTGEWKDINAISPIADLLLAHVEGRLGKREADYFPLTSNHEDPNATVMLPGALVPLTDSDLEPDLVELKPLEPPAPPEPSKIIPPKFPNSDGPSRGEEADPEATQVGETGQTHKVGEEAEDDDRTQVGEKLEESRPSGDAPKADEPAADQRAPIEQDRMESFDMEGASHLIHNSLLGDQAKPISEQRTLMVERPKSIVGIPIRTKSGKPEGKPKNKIFQAVKFVAMLAATIMIGQEILWPDDDDAKAVVRWRPIRPTLPQYIKGNPRPQESGNLYQEGLQYYAADNVIGYKKAAEKFREACANDITNVKALAMLASTYLNLIDSSNKDETYFNVIWKLIEMSRAKNLDLAETVIADVEFYVTVNRAEAAQIRIVEFTKGHQYGLEMFYFLALAFYNRGDAKNAAFYLNQIPDAKAFSAKIFYLRGLIAEKLSDFSAANLEYQKAVKFKNDHAKSHLKIAELAAKRGELKEAGKHLEYLVNNTALLGPKDLAQTYYYHAQLSLLFQKPEVALGDMERAVKLDHENHDYQLELYTLRAKAGDKSVKGVQRDARMYYFMGEGEKALREGKTHEGLVQFMQAHEINPKSPLPLVKIGDMFRLQNEFNNAMENYKKATKLAGDNIEVWSKYINSLILNYEWDEAKKTMDKFRDLPVPQSAIDKAAADWFSRQGQHQQAQVYYKKAMARETVDPDVYIAYAKSLMATKNFKEAPFFFALALRFDPLSIDAILGTAKCVAETESIDRAISMLQDELGKASRASAAILTAIAEFHLQRGDIEPAQQNIDQARTSDPDYANLYKVQAKIYLANENVDKLAVDHTLDAYRSYLERNPSDAQGYLERYNLFIRKLQYEKASDELAKVFAIYPKYPKFHFYKGWLFAAQGNHKAAAEEYDLELQNNPDDVRTLIALGKERMELGMIIGAPGKDGAPGVPGARDLFNKAMQIQPENSEAKHQAGYAAYILKNYPAAVALYSGALVYDKANPLIHKRLGMAYKEMGDNQMAARSFHKYLEMEPDAPDKAEFERYR